MLSSQRIAELAVLYKFGTLSPTEQQQFDQWLSTLTEAQRDQFLSTISEANTVDALRMMFEADSSFEKNLSVFLSRNNALRPVEKKTIRWRYISYAAAAILIFAVAGVYWYAHNKKTGSIEQVTVSSASDIPPGSDKAILVLSDGSNVNLSDAANGHIGQQGNATINKNGEGLVSYTAGTPSGSTAFNTIRTPRGGKYAITLPDGTKAWLNAASSLHFPVEFSGANREVEIEGEIYFEVAKDPRKPFIVHTSASNTIEVLGTHFNVMAYKEEAAIATTLLEGSVKVRDVNGSVIIKPGQAAIAKNGSLSVDKNADIDMAIGWTKGMFVFNNANIKTVMNALSRWYDTDIKYELSNNALDKHFEVSVDRNTSLNKILNALQSSGFEFKREGKTIIVSAK